MISGRKETGAGGEKKPMRTRACMVVIRGKSGIYISDILDQSKKKKRRMEE